MMADYIAGMVIDSNCYVANMPEAEYHADPCLKPSFSASIGKTLMKQTPAHAWHQHPRLNPDQEEEHSTDFDLGSAVHSMLLGGPAVHVIQATNKEGEPVKAYQSNAAKEERQKAYDAGKIPMLVHQYEIVNKVSQRVRDQMDVHPDLTKDSAITECSMFWYNTKHGVWCRSRDDILILDSGDVYDLKFTTVPPALWDRHCFNLAYDISAAHYLDGVRTVLGKDGRYKFINVDRKWPHYIFVAELTERGYTMGRQRADEATRRFAHALHNDDWHGYHNETYFYDPPPWMEERWGTERAFHHTMSGEHDMSALEELYKS